MIKIMDCMDLLYHYMELWYYNRFFIFYFNRCYKKKTSKIELISPVIVINIVTCFGYFL